MSCKFFLGKKIYSTANGGKPCPEESNNNLLHMDCTTVPLAVFCYRNWVMLCHINCLHVCKPKVWLNSFTCNFILFKFFLALMPPWMKSLWPFWQMLQSSTFQWCCSFKPLILFHKLYIFWCFPCLKVTCPLLMMKRSVNLYVNKTLFNSTYLDSFASFLSLQIIPAGEHGPKQRIDLIKILICFRFKD